MYTGAVILKKNSFFDIPFSLFVLTIFFTLILGQIYAAETQKAEPIKTTTNWKIPQYFENNVIESKKSFSAVPSKKELEERING